MFLRNQNSLKLSQTIINPDEILQSGPQLQTYIKYIVTFIKQYFVQEQSYRSGENQNVLRYQLEGLRSNGKVTIKGDQNLSLRL